MFAVGTIEEWDDPRTAAAASYESQKRLQAMLIATEIAMMRERDAARAAGDRKRERELDADLNDARGIGMQLSNLLNHEGGIRI